jgi:hypothetical protein
MYVFTRDGRVEIYDGKLVPLVITKVEPRFVRGKPDGLSLTLQNFERNKSYASPLDSDAQRTLMMDMEVTDPKELIETKLVGLVQNGILFRFTSTGSPRAL